MKIENHSALKKNSSNPYFSILIPSWNNLKYLKTCIDSIRRHSQVPYEILVYVNEGIDGTLDWVKEQMDIKFSYSHENVGVCHAMNALRKIAEANYLIYLNDDMYVLPEWDTVLRDEIEILPNNRFYLSSTMIEPIAQSACSIEKNYGQKLETFNEIKLLKEYKSFSKKDWLGSTWPPSVVHKDLWDEVGGYSVEFSPGLYSDPDFSRKLWEVGVRYFKGLGQSRVYHFGSISVKRVKNNNGYYQFIKKWKMSNGTFCKYYLLRGEPFVTDAKARKIPILVQLKNIYYRLKVIYLGI